MKCPIFQKSLGQFPVAGNGLWRDFAFEPVDCDKLWSNYYQDMASDARATLLNLLYDSLISAQQDGHNKKLTRPHILSDRS